MSKVQSSAFSLEVDDKAIAWVTIDVPNESQNTLKSEFVDEFNQLLDQIESDNSIKGVVVISGKPTNFIAGADISQLENIKSADEATELSLKGHQIFMRLENLELPVVAAIHGACLGGGLELALACSHRIATNEKITRIGLPEVQLGVLPGGGGTQRLPRLVGIASALDLMLTGKQLVAKQAKKLNLVDEVVPFSNLRKASQKLALKMTGKKRRKTSQPESDLKFSSLLKASELQKLVLESNTFGRNIIFDKALETVNKKTRGNYPAPTKIIDCVKIGMEEGFDAGLAIEAKFFGELVVSKEAEQLMNIFFATTEMKKDTGIDSDFESKNIQRVAVLGGGLMGAGISYITASKAGKMVRIKDISEKGINHALKYCWELFRKQVKRRRITLNDANKKFANISGTTRYTGFKKSDLIIEAVFEDLKLKQSMIKDIEDICSENVIFATNTSSIPITEIAKASKRPERVIGLHYFSPVEKMPLLEVIKGKETSDEVIATCVEFGKQQGKTVIVVEDGAGFYVNRILTPYMNEAGHLVAEGVPIDVIDQTLVDAGFPVGPMNLLDEVGIDVGVKVSEILQNAFGERMSPPALFEKLTQDDRKGRKNKKGFYQYTDTNKKSKKAKQVDESVYSVLGVEPSTHLDKQMIIDRCLLMMINEAVRCLDEKIIRNARDGDVGSIFGIGFPPFLGGPFRYVDSMGAKNIVAKLQSLEEKYGERFKPAKLLIANAESEVKFY